MTYALWALLLAAPPALPPPEPAPYRVVSTPHVHVGLRPAARVGPDERAAGLTIQVTVFWP